jgi:hypothetical protein
LALRPGEADLRSLAERLEGVHDAGGDVSVALAELAATEAGVAALDAVFSSWRKAREGCPSPGWSRDEPIGEVPVSEFVRWDLIRTIAPALHRLSTETWRGLVVRGAHPMSHVLSEIDESILPEVVELLCGENICRDRVGDFVRLAEAIPGVGEALIAGWRRLSRSERRCLDAVRYPGEALAPLIERGSSEAIDVFVEWLPESWYGQPSWVGNNRTIDAKVFDVPRVREVALRCLEGGHPDSLRWDSRLLRRLGPAWQSRDDVWEAVDSLLNERRIQPWVWGYVADACSNAMVPEAVARRWAATVETLLRLHGAPGVDPDTYHALAPEVLRFVDALGLLPHLRSLIVEMAGLECAPLCWRVQPLAAVMLIASLETPEQVRLSESMVEHYQAGTREFKSIPAVGLASLVRPKPELWMGVLLGRVEGQHGLVRLEDRRLLLALPVRERGYVAANLLERGFGHELPWVEFVDESTERCCRLADLLRRLVYEGRGSVDSWHR